MTVEKNDVDFNRLFTWGNKFEILDKNAQPIITAYIRLIGDAEVNRSRVYALRKSAELRNKLKTINSDEYLAYIPPLEGTTKQNLIDMILIYEVRGITREAVNTISVPYPTEPKSTASLEKQEAHQKAIDEWPKKREAAIRKETDRLVAIRKKELDKETVETLHKICEGDIISELCEQEMVTRFNEISAYFGTYSDENFKTRMFNSVEEFNALPSEIKNQFIGHYSTLEITTDNLKKSEEATQ